MIPYTVVWHNDAQAQLAPIWLDSTNRSKIALSADTIDSDLAYDAESKGEEVEGGLRELVIPPLKVLFRVIELDRMVKVINATLLE